MSPLTVLFLIVLIDLIGFGIVIPLLPFYALRVGAGPELVALAIAAFSLGQFIAAPVWGRLSDRFGRRPILVVTLAGSVVCYLVLGVVDSIVLVILVRLANGLMAGNIATAYAYAADISTPQTRARAMGLVGAAFGLGFIFGPALGGVLAGNDAASADLVAVSLAAAGMSALALVGTLLFLPEPDGRTAADAGAPPRPSGLRAGLAVLARPGLGGLVWIGFLLIGAFALMEASFALFGHTVLGLGPQEIGWSFVAIGLVTSTIQGGLIGSLSRRFGEAALVRTGAVLLAAGLCALPFGRTHVEVTAALMLLGVGIGLWSPSLSSLVSQRAAPGERGLVMGVYQGIGSLARIVYPASSGVLFARIDPGAPFLAAAAAAGVALVLAVRACRPDVSGRPITEPRV